MNIVRAQVQAQMLCYDCRFLRTAAMLPIASLRHPEFVRGLKDCLPVLFGMLPFALILGAQAAQKGMSLLETVLMMGLNYAGGSEFGGVLKSVLIKISEQKAARTVSYL